MVQYLTVSTRAPYAIGVDIGTTNTKVVAVAGVQVLASFSAPTPSDGKALSGTVLTLVRRAVQACPGRPAAVGIASMAETGLPLDHRGVPLAPLVRWQDAAGAAEAADALARSLGRDELFEATGVRVGPKAPLVVWLTLRRSGGLGHLAHWAGAADFAHLTLTGRLRTDHTLAGRTMAYRLPDPGEPLTPGFDAALLAEAGLTPDQLPHVGLPGESLDTVTRAAASETGLPEGTPVLVAGHDHQVGAWAAGVRRVGEVADSIGTAEAVLTLVGESEVRRPLAAEGFSLVRAIDGATEAVLAGSPSSGAFLQWCADRWAGGDVAGFLAGTAGAARTLLARDSFLLPYPAGRQCPAPDAAAHVRRISGGAFAPLEATGGVPYAVAAIEAVCYQAQWMLDRQRELARVPEGARGRLTVLGEPIRANALWQGVKATLAGGRATLVTEEQPVAVGAALLALVRSGAVEDDAAIPSSGLRPIPTLAGAYRGGLDAFKAAATASRQARS